MAFPLLRLVCVSIPCHRAFPVLACVIDAIRTVEGIASVELRRHSRRTELLFAMGTSFSIVSDSADETCCVQRQNIRSAMVETIRRIAAD